MPVTAHDVAEVVRAHPAVVRLSGGPYDTVATYLPGERLRGVRIGEPGEPVQIAVVLRLDRPLPEVVGQLRDRVSGLCGTTRVDVTVDDVESGP